MLTHTVVAITRQHKTSNYFGDVYWSATWHQPASGQLEEKEEVVVWNGEKYVLLEKGVGLEGECVSFYIKISSTEVHKIYTLTPTSGGSVEGIICSLRNKGLRFR
jgi:hypothetical protein